jgi:hypothetical protein
MKTVTRRFSSPRLSTEWPGRTAKKTRNVSKGPRCNATQEPEGSLAAWLPSRVGRWVEWFLPGAKALLACREESSSKRSLSSQDFDRTVEQLAAELASLEAAGVDASWFVGPGVRLLVQAKTDEDFGASPVISLRLPHGEKCAASLPGDVEMSDVDDDLEGVEMPPRPSKTVMMRFKHIGRRPPRISDPLED